MLDLVLDDPHPGRALVLGSTPEFCDLLTAKGIQHVVIDHSAVFHEQSLSLRAYRPDDTEVVVQADWMAGLEDESLGEFQIVLSDLTSGNVPYAERRRFYDLIGQRLVVGGRFVDKVLTNSPGYCSLDHLDRTFVDLTVNIASLNEFSRAYYFTSELVQQHGVVDVDQITSVLARRFSATGSVQEVLLQYVDLLTPHGSLWHYGRDWADLSEEYCSWGSTDVLISYTEGAFAHRLSLFETVRDGKS